MKILNMCLVHTLAMCVSVIAQPTAPADQEHAAGVPVSIAREVSFDSKVLGETRRILVHVPEQERFTSEDAKDKFPVLYLLDAEYNFTVTVGIAQTLQRASLIPKMIIVGIPNTNREYDLSPAMTKSKRNVGFKSGGAERFRRFLSEELIPHVESVYDCGTYRIIAGHSIGGLFALHTLATHPEDFAAYLAISPSTWWDEKSIVGSMKSLLANYPSTGERSLFLSLANEGDPSDTDIIAMNEGFSELIDVLKTKQAKPLHWGHKYFRGEDHLSTVTPSTFFGLKSLFSDWNLDKLYEKRNLKSLARRLSKLSQKYGLKARPHFDSIIAMWRHFSDAGDHEQAIAVMRLGQSAYETSFTMNARLGEAYEAGGRIDEAIASYEESRRLAVLRSSPMLEWTEKRLRSARQKQVSETATSKKKKH